MFDVHEIRSATPRRWCAYGMHRMDGMMERRSIVVFETGRGPGCELCPTTMDFGLSGDSDAGRRVERTSQGASKRLQSAVRYRYWMRTPASPDSQF